MFMNVWAESHFITGRDQIQLELFQSENAILQFTFSGLLYLVRSSWTSCASISITDDSPVLSRPPLVSAVSVCSINIQIKCQHTQSICYVPKRHPAATTFTIWLHVSQQKGNNLDVQLYISSRHKMVHGSWDWGKEQVEHHVSEILWVIIWS